MAKNISQIILDSQKASKDLFTSSEELASTSHEVNALSEEITATIQQISRSASNQSELAIRGIGDVKEMSEAVDQTLQNIETSMQVIEDIASQTNILALNAAIEAARAGEFGRGFAVVADNVRRLAEETKENAVDIKSLTEEIVNSIGGSVITLQETLQGFAAQSEEFSASSEQVAAATEEQSASMHQMTQAAQDLAAMSVKLSNQVMEFKL
ncbi:MAG: methyl-accepting chemotaxis protein [Candidatus Hodarchaeales archaeon]